MPTPSPGAGDGDALQIEVAVRVAEAAQDGEGLDRSACPDPEPVGVGGRSEHRAVLGLFGAADAKLEARRALDRHHRADVGRAPPGVRSARKRSCESGDSSEGLKVASPIAPRAASVYTPPALERARRSGPWRWALSSAVEHYLDMVGVRGSIPLAPTISGPRRLILAPIFGERRVTAAPRSSPPQPIDGLHHCHCGRRRSPTRNDRSPAGRS